MKRVFARLNHEWQFWCVLIVSFVMFLFFALSFIEEAKEREYSPWMNGIHRYNNMSDLQEQIYLLHESIEEVKSLQGYGYEQRDILTLEQREVILNYLYDHGLEYEQAASGDLGVAMMERTVFIENMTEIVFFILVVASMLLLFIIHNWGISNGTCVMEYIVHTRSRIFWEELSAYFITIGSLTIYLMLAIACFCLLIPSKAAILIFSFEKNVTGVSSMQYCIMCGITFSIHLLFLWGIQFLLSHVCSNRSISIVAMLFVPIGLQVLFGRLNGNIAVMLSPSPAGALSGEVSIIIYFSFCVLKLLICALLIALAYRVNNIKPILPDND